MGRKRKGTERESADQPNVIPYPSPQAIINDISHGNDGGKGKTAKNIAILEEIFQKYALIMHEGKVYVISDKYDPSVGMERPEFSTIGDIKKWYTNKLVTVEGHDGKTKTVNPVDIWLSSPLRREYIGIVFDPENKSGAEYYNLWKGLRIQPKPGKCDRIIEHIYEVICNGSDEWYDYLICWLKNMFFDPCNRPGTAVVMRGGQGTGKGTLVNILRPILGRHFGHIISPHLLLGRFNSHISDKLLLFLDEAFWAGDKSCEGTLKGLVTEEAIMVEQKGREAFIIRNYIRIMIASNNEWVVPAGIDERRFFVLDVSSKYQQNTKYFSKLYEEIENGGREAFLAYLQEYECPEVNLRQIPKTEALIDQKVRSMDSVGRFWWDAIHDGELWEIANDGYVARNEVYKGYVDMCRAQKVRAESERYFWEYAKRYIGGCDCMQRRRVEGRLTRVVRLPDIEAARAQMRAYLMSS